MKFPKKYIIPGERKLHSGQKSKIFYDVNGMLTDNYYRDLILNEIPISNHYVGIATGGALIGILVSKERQNSKFSMIKDRELKGDLPLNDYLLIDDVTTTERSLLEAIDIIGKPPSGICVCVDRRLEKKLSIISVFEI